MKRVTPQKQLLNPSFDKICVISNFKGDFCLDLVHRGGDGLAVRDLTSDGLPVLRSGFFLIFLRIGPIEVIALIVFIGYALHSLDSFEDECGAVSFLEAVTYSLHIAHRLEDADVKITPKFTYSRAFFDEGMAALMFNRNIQCLGAFASSHAQDES